MFATLPKGAKPSKAASKDQTRPILCRGEIRQTGDEGYELVTTNSYVLARVPLTVSGNGDPLTCGPVSPDALAAIEKTGSFEANGVVTPCNKYGAPDGPSYQREDAATAGKFPDVDYLMPEYDSDGFTIGLDARLLLDLAEALGASGKGRSRTVSLTFCTRNGQPDALRPMRVEPIHHGTANSGAQGLLMPVRITV